MPCRLFDEFYETYEVGRSKVDPGTIWYQSELDFFDLIVIPLAKKLAACGIFEEAGEELLENAIANREEWEANGRQVLEFYVAHYKECHVYEQNQHDGYDHRSQGGESRNDEDSTHQQRGGTGAFRRLSNSVSSSGDEKQGSVDNDMESKLGQSLARLPDAKRDSTVPSTGNASVAETVSDGDSGIQDADIVYAVLENPGEPDDFYSYSLMTPKQLRQRKEGPVDGQETSTVGSREAKRERRRRVRRVASAASNSSGAGKMRRGESFHSRGSVFSLSSGHGDETPVAPMNKRATTLI